MEQCPLAYVDTCEKCARYGQCSPSQAVQKLAALEDMLRELKKMVQSLVEQK